MYVCVDSDPNTLFRGNTLLSKMLDELMKLVGLPYLHDTLRAFIDNVRINIVCQVNKTFYNYGLRYL